VGGWRWTGRTPAVGILALALALLAGCGGSDKSGTKAAAAKGQVVHFQKPTETGPDPFTNASDVRGRDKVQVGSGPYGGTGSDLVCDRELLIRSLRARPERLRAWAEVVHVEPTLAAVARYIRRLRPVTLTRDTRVTNHSFVDGRATGYQAILEAGTAVLVDEHGVPRARCRCGNPLLEPVFIPEATCYGCPPNYTPPPDCHPWSACWEAYKHPPPVYGHRATASRPPPTGGSGGAQLNPQAYFTPSSGQVGEAFTLHISGFSPNARVGFTITRPDGRQDPPYSISTDGSGSGSYSFSPTGSNNVLGTYTATIRDPSGATTSATATLHAAGGGGSGGGGAQKTVPGEGGTGTAGAGTGSAEKQPSPDGTGQAPYP
jgi:hypothetical protein